MDLFDEKNLRPMLIGASGQAFDSPAYVFELKLDGDRAVAYLDPSGPELRNKRGRRMLPLFPELADIHRQARGRCILDGEYIVMAGGRPKFSEIQRRCLLSNPFKIRLAAEKLPVSFVAFDILYLDGKPLTGLPLLERRALLEKTVSESPRLAVSRAVAERGRALYARAGERGLEGIVAKLSSSLYYPGRRTKEWIKIKNLLDDDFVVCGYIDKENHMASLVLGQYRGQTLVYKGHVTLGVSGEPFRRIRESAPAGAPPFPVPAGRGGEGAQWIVPALVCTVQFMERTAAGGMRQPVFKGLRPDKDPLECRESAP